MQNSVARLVKGIAIVAVGAALHLSLPALRAAAVQPDAQMKRVLDQLAALGGKPIEKLTPAEARQQPTPADAVKALLQKQPASTAPEPAVKVEDRSIPGPDGTLPVRVYRPGGGGGPLPVLLYFHGGGWVIANKDVYDATPRALATLVKAVAISVDYRQGPEHRFPAAHDDAFAAYAWVMKNAGEFGGDPRRIAVVGESAGGNLAIAVSMMARDKGIALPRYQVAVYPIAGSDTNTESYRENAAAKPLNKPLMEWFFAHYLRSASDGRDPRINLVGASLSGLPPTSIVTAEIDPLRSEGQQLATKLKAAGVTVQQNDYPGVTHEFFGMAAVIDKARDAQEQVASALARALER